MYLIFQTLEAAQTAQARIDSNIVAVIQEHEPELVGDRGIRSRNAATGLISYESEGTTTWCNPVEHGDVWYLVKPLTVHSYFVGVDLLYGVEDYIDADYLPGEEPAIAPEDAPETIDVESEESTDE
jgi:hypothetical protein